MSFSNTETGDAPADPYTKANKDDVPLPQKMADFTNFITDCKFGMMTTRESGSSRLVSRGMALAGTERNGVDLIFQVNTESGKTDDIASDPDINVAFTNAKGEWASVAGRAVIVTDRDTVAKWYNSTLKAWMGDLGDGKHDGSKDDPRIGVIRLTAETVTYSLADKGMIKAAVEVAQSTVRGKAAQINSLRHISEAELKQLRG